MRLNVRHETHYEYEGELAYSAQRLYLTPLTFEAQKVVNWRISAPGMDNALTYLDGFGNRVHVVTYQNQQGPVSIVAEGTVDVTEAAGLVRKLPMAAPVAVLLRQTRVTAPSEAMIAMTQETAKGPVLGQLHALMNGIHDRVVYEIGPTDAHTSGAEAFADGRGVCQDHAHIFAGMARHLGIPARYVTGYLVTGIGASSTAAHAWAEALVPDLGWVGFDPANNTCPTDHYVRVAGGIDAAAVTPIRGSRRGGEGERMRVEVRVEIAQQ